MAIVERNLCHMVPKAITLYIINGVEQFINAELLKLILDIPNDDLVGSFRFVY